MPKVCLNCEKSFEPDFKWRNFCLECRHIEHFFNRFYPRFRALQIVSGMEIPSCERCGETDMRILVINQKKFKSSSSASLYMKIIRKYEVEKLGIEKIKEFFDIRCHNCNFICEFERGKLEAPDPFKFLKYVKLRNKMALRQPSSAMGKKIISKKLGNINCPHKDLPTYAGGKCYACYKKPYNQNYYQTHKEKFVDYRKEYASRKAQKSILKEL